MKFRNLLVLTIITMFISTGVLFANEVATEETTDSVENAVEITSMTIVEETSEKIPEMTSSEISEETSEEIIDPFIQKMLEERAEREEKRKKVPTKEDVAVYLEEVADIEGVTLICTIEEFLVQNNSNNPNILRKSPDGFVEEIYKSRGDEDIEIYIIYGNGDGSLDKLYEKGYYTLKSDDEKVYFVYIEEKIGIKAVVSEYDFDTKKFANLFDDSDSSIETTTCVVEVGDIVELTETTTADISGFPGGAGDADLDGTLTANDAAIVMQYVLNNNEELYTEKQVLNIRSFSNVIQKDATAPITAKIAAKILQMVLGV